MFRIRYSVIAWLAAAATLMTSSSVQASFQLRLTSFTSAGVQNGQMTFTDEVIGEGSVGTPGFISLPGNFSLGTFTIISSQGSSKPLYAAGPIAQMHLNSFQISSSAGGQLRVELTDTGWGATGEGNLIGNVGGIQAAGGTVNFQAYKSLTNQEFSQANLAASLSTQTFNTTVYGTTLSALHGAIGAPYSMTLVAFLTQGANSTSSFDWDVQNTPVPEPATIISAILAAPLLGGYFLRRRNAKMVTA